MGADVPVRGPNHLTLPTPRVGALPLPPEARRGALDEPEPTLAMLGPPAATRLMVELWRADPRVRSRFDLADPLHRRDFALWLGREGESLGLDQCSVAAALAVLQRGTSLLRPAPRWPSQGSLPADRKVDAWLAQTIGESPRAFRCRGHWRCSGN
jgi:hypothetical protein